MAWFIVWSYMSGCNIVGGYYPCKEPDSHTVYILMPSEEVCLYVEAINGAGFRCVSK